MPQLWESIKAKLEYLCARQAAGATEALDFLTPVQASEILDEWAHWVAEAGREAYRAEQAESRVRALESDLEFWVRLGADWWLVFVPEDQQAAYTIDGWEQVQYIKAAFARLPDNLRASLEAEFNKPQTEV